MPHQPSDESPTTVTADVLRQWPLPSPGDDKHDRGAVVVIGGAGRTPGAALLAGLAALRVGAGQLRVGVAATAAPTMAVAIPEALVAPLPCDPRTGAIEASAADTAGELLDGAQCLCLGPGLDDPERTQRLVRSVLTALPASCSVVVDAFALGALPAMNDLVTRVGHRLLLTPNGDEANLLLSDDGGSTGSPDPAEAAARISSRYAATVSVRGCTKEVAGRLFVDRAGSAGLGTSGSGDVLAGLAAGLLARGATPAQAGVWASHVHALAGQRLARRLGPLGYLARELLEEVPSVVAGLAA